MEQRQIPPMGANADHEEMKIVPTRSQILAVPEAVPANAPINC
jgi:hypothetical protein